MANDLATSPAFAMIKAAEGIPDLGVAFPVPGEKLPDSRESVPCYSAQGILMQRIDNGHSFRAQGQSECRNPMSFPANSR